MARLRRPVAISTLACVVAMTSALGTELGCSSILGIYEPEIEAQDAGSTREDSGEVEDDGEAPPPDTDAGREAGTCPTSRGASMVPLGPTAAGKQFCVDTTEVTRAEYDMFVAAAVNPSTQGAECAWNTTFAASVDAGAPTDAPIVGVDWCDAKAYCAWAGKRLCGAAAGGPLPNGPALGNAQLSQWLYACSNRGSTTFPYGGVYAAGTCNIARPDGGPADAAAFPQCKTTDAIFATVGNVWEWVDSCEALGGAANLDTCSFMGGAFSSPAAYDCTTSSAVTRESKTADIGFRCCADL